MQIGLQIPDFTNPAGPGQLAADLARIARTADEVGFHYLAVMDHFFQIDVVGPPEREMLEAYTTLGFLAAHTSRVELLTVMTGVIYRYPGLLAKTVTTLDVLSAGRAWLGIGAGWNEEEARGLGVPFPPVAARFEMLEEALQIYQQMGRGDDTPYHGKHFHLERPLNSPRPLRQPYPPIMVGGGGEKKTLRLVAKYADACNLFATPDVERKLDILREHCVREGRDYDEILKTAYYVPNVGAKGERVDAVLADLRRLADLGFGATIGVVPNVYDITPLEIIGREVIPAVASW
ncbi:MAG: LLM class F420-dependent oxidoreductase [Actinobacteria bacterium 13_2_20CM_2_71_6]|nr:MAG: LLM class F420-dependent oxidoreductase [Actinobacteria bacterium 13_2_20CM_2_71_6]